MVGGLGLGLDAVVLFGPGAMGLRPCTVIKPCVVRAATWSSASTAGRFSGVCEALSGIVLGVGAQLTIWHWAILVKGPGNLDRLCLMYGAEFA